MGRTVLQLVAAILILQVPSSVKASQASLTSSVSTVHEGFTKELTLNCSLPYSSTSGFSALISLIVSKTATPKDSIYTEIASITQFSPDTVAVKNTSFGSHAIGQLVANQDAFLTLQWSYPVKAVQGRYKCEAFGVDKGGHPVSALASVVINEGPVDLDMVLGKMAEMEKEEMKREQEATDNVAKLTAIQNKNNQLMSDLENYQTSSTLTVNNIMTNKTKIELQIKTYQEELLKLKIGIKSTKSLFHESSIGPTGHKYIISNFTTLNPGIIEADALCYIHGGYLAEVDSEAEYDFIVDFIRPIVPTNTNYRIMLGATDNERDERWKFLTSGGYATFFDWGPDTRHGNGYDCQFLTWQSWQSGNRKYGWRMLPSSCVGGSYNLLVCEIDTR